MIVREKRIIDSNYRISLPRNIGYEQGDEVYFELTKKGDLVIRKVKKKEDTDDNKKDVFFGDSKGL